MFELALENGNIFEIALDDFTRDAYYIRIWNQARNHIHSELHIVPLWNGRNVAFQRGDYYQKTFNSYPPNQGFGGLLMRLLLENRNEIPTITNLYSTSWVKANNEDDTDFITVDAEAFWEAMVRRGLGERIEEISRYRIFPRLFR